MGEGLRGEYCNRQKGSTGRLERTPRLANPSATQLQKPNQLDQIVFMSTPRRSLCGKIQR